MGAIGVEGASGDPEQAGPQTVVEHALSGENVDVAEAGRVAVAEECSTCSTHADRTSKVDTPGRMPGYLEWCGRPVTGL